MLGDLFTWFVAVYSSQPGKTIVISLFNIKKHSLTFVNTSKTKDGKMINPTWDLSSAPCLSSRWHRGCFAALQSTCGPRYAWWCCPITRECWAVLAHAALNLPSRFDHLRTCGRDGSDFRIARNGLWIRGVDSSSSLFQHLRSLAGLRTSVPPSSSAESRAADQVLVTG